MRGAADRGCEPTGVVAGGDRPSIARGIDLADGANVIRRKAERIGDNLCQHGAVALPLRCRSGVNADRAQGSNATVAVACAPFLAPARRRSSAVSTVVM